MKRKILLLLGMTSIISVGYGQKKQEPVTGFAITAMEKGGRSWKEVRLVNINSGEQVKQVYQSNQDVEALNARTKKPVVKKESGGELSQISMARSAAPVRKIINLDHELDKATGNGNATTVRSVVVVKNRVEMDKPFSTNSAAMAYDKKHERLYYTPMSINQLRYIDLKTNKIYYFEDEPFGVVKGFGDVGSQITRMVIASDGNGYALSNDGNHLIRFTTGKKPQITDLGALSDDAANTKSSIHSSSGFGGDMIADASGNLYLITANRNVFKINIESKVATHQGTIQGLPRGFSTNGAMVEGGSKVIVCSSESTLGYFRFDLTTLQAEKVSQSGSVFNASDLANGLLAFDKKKKDRKQPEEVKEEAPVVVEEAARQKPKVEVQANNGIAVYPNPVTSGQVKVSFTDQPAGRYQVQFLDISGKLIMSQEVNINGKVQIEEIRLPEVAKGNYLLKVVGAGNGVSVTNKLVVQ